MANFSLLDLLLLLESPRCEPRCWGVFDVREEDEDLLLLPPRVFPRCCCDRLCCVRPVIVALCLPEEEEEEEEEEVEEEEVEVEGEVEEEDDMCFCDG